MIIPARWVWIFGTGIWVKTWSGEQQSCHFACLSVCAEAGVHVCVREVSLNKQVPKSAPITPIKQCSHHDPWVLGPRQPVSLFERVDNRPDWHTQSSTEHAHRGTKIYTCIPWMMSQFFWCCLYSVKFKKYIKNPLRLNIVHTYLYIYILKTALVKQLVILSSASSLKKSRTKYILSQCTVELES